MPPKPRFNCACARTLKRLFRRAPNPRPGAAPNPATQPSTPVATETTEKPDPTTEKPDPTTEKPDSKLPLQPQANSNRIWSACSSTLSTLVGCTFPGVLSPLKATMMGFLRWIDSMEDIKDSDEEYINLAAELKKAVDLLTPQLDNPNCSALSESIGKTVESIAASFKEIEAERNLTSGRLHVGAQMHHNKIRKCWHAINGALQGLRMQIQIEMFGLETKARVDKLIESLRPSQSALYGSNPQGIVRQYCAKDTRISILEDLDSWSDDPYCRLMWMNGMAGTGKTTIAYSHAKALYDRRKPAASFFCSKVDRDVSRIIPTIAYQLASLSPVFRDQLGGLLEKDPSLASSTGIPHQFEHLLKTPFKGVDQGSEDIVVLIDALDECDDREQVGYFLDQLAQWIEGLPLKFLVTSRPEAWIHRKMPTHGSKLAKSISLHEIDVKEDIKLYLEQELASMSLSNEQLVRLAEQSGSLFIYAATLVRYIKPSGGAVPTGSRLITVLRLGTQPGSKSSNLYREMDQLYSLVLNNALGGSELDEPDRAKVWIVLKTVICAKEPISIKSVAALCGLGDSIDDLSFTLERLNSVIYAPETSGLVSVFHASFPDFMFDPERSKELFCDPDEHNHLMAEQCFGLMKQLRFNICQLSSSCIADGSAITQEQVEDAIEAALSYACHYWAEHLTKSKRSDLCEELKDFFCERLLFWMEVLNLKGSIALGGDELFRVISWLPDVSNDTDLTSFAEDARNFVTSFAANPISASTPHIYTSLLPFCPRSSAVFQHYWKYFQRLTEPDHRAMQLREVAALASWKHDSVLSVAYSHDGSKIAFGCINGTVGVQTSHEEASIFMVSSPSEEAHQGPVRSVAFSPGDEVIGIHSYLASGSDDGTIRTWNIHTTDRGTPSLRSICRPDPPHGKIRTIVFSPNGNIASGSSDCTVCVWDLSEPKGKLVQGPLRGHTAAIWSIAYSPDGRYLASASDDHTIRVWNPKTGQQILSPLTTQTDHINSISFSPNGKLLASGSSDRTICVWNIPQGTLALEPFQAHGNKVQRVRFSPNGRHLASSSLDRTIRVWDPRDGKLIGGPFEGHIGPIYSIAFSPDNTRIISGSPDGTIQLWDPTKSALGNKSLDYHADGIVSVAFSPDGRYLASCSYDATLRVWDVSNRSSPIPVGDPYRDHTAEVMSLAFSPDGTRIVTASLDGTARVWNIHSTAEPFVFRGHKGKVRSVAFAPDGSFIVSGGGDTTVRMWNSSTGEPLLDPLEGHTDEIKSVTVSPDGTTIASGSADKTICVWDIGAEIASTLRVITGHTGKVWSVAFSPDGTKLASCSSDGTVCLWNPRDGSPIGEPIKVYDENKIIASIAFSPGGDYIAWGSADSTIRMWDLSKGEYVGQPFEGHRDTVWSVAFAPGGTHIASGSYDGTIRIWNTQKRTPWADEDDDTYGDWVLERNGWIKRGKDLLLWVPHEIARSLLTPHCRSVISSCGSLHLDLKNVALGDQWQSCLAPQPAEQFNLHEYVSDLPCVCFILT